MNRLDESKRYFNPIRLDQYSYEYHQLQLCLQENIQWLIRVAEAADELNNQIENYGVDGFTLEARDKHAHISFKELRKTLEDRRED